jgi:hypothetical protein
MEVVNFEPVGTQKLIPPSFCFWAFQQYVDGIFHFFAQGGAFSLPILSLALFASTNPF